MQVNVKVIVNQIKTFEYIRNLCVHRERWETVVNLNLTFLTGKIV